MRSTPLIATAAALTLLVLAGIGLFVYDNGREDTIAKGITVNGVAIGGLTAGEARARVQAEVAAPLRRPIEARYRKRTFTLAAAKADVSVDVAATVQQALDRSRDGNLLTRSVRGLTGGSIDEDIPVAVSYDKRAVRRTVQRIADKVDRKAVDADVDISTGGVETVAAQKGRVVRERRLMRGLRSTITAVGDDRTVPIKARITKPKVTTGEVAEKYPSIVVVNRANFQVSLYEDLKLSKTYTVAIGQAGYDTPVGRYAIESKQVDPYWHVPDSGWAGGLAGQVIPPGPTNPLKARWMGIYNGAGFHGTDATYSLGSAASHGCVRMAIPDVIDLYDRVDVGTPVYIG